MARGVTDVNTHNGRESAFPERSINPEIDWAEGTMKIESKMERKGKVDVEQVVANRTLRQCWWKDGVLEDPLGTLWCAARYTFLTELAEKVARQKAG